jgi:hypothetical protein
MAEKIGPVGAEELRLLAQSGKLGAEDLVWREGMAEWLPARRIPQLGLATATGPAQVPVSALPVDSAGPNGFKQIGGMFFVAGTGFFGEVIASDHAMYLILRRRRSDTTTAAVGGGLIGGLIAGAIAASLGKGKAAQAALVKYAALPAGVVRHPDWPGRKVKDDTDVLVIPRDRISPAGVVHPAWSNLLLLNFAGQRIKIEYTLFAGTRAKQFLEKAGWPLTWRGSASALDAESRALSEAGAEIAAPARAARNRMLLRALAATVAVAVVVTGGVWVYRAMQPPAPPKIPLAEAAKTGNLDAIRQHKEAGTDMNKRDGSGWWPLLYAADAGQAGAVRTLLDAGADPNQLDRTFATAAHRAASGGKNECLRVLIEHGADPNLRGIMGMTALHYASAGNNTQGVRLLVGRGGVDVNAKDDLGRTPLIHVVERATPTSEQCVKLLLDAKADPNIPDKSGKTPLKYVREQAATNPSLSSVETMLKDAGAKD